MTAKRLTRIAHIVNGTLLVLLFVGSLWVYPSVPEQIPTGTGPGTVHYEEKTVLGWLTGPLFALGMTAFLYVPARQLRQSRHLRTIIVLSRARDEQ